MEDHFGMAILLDATLGTGSNHELPESSPVVNASGVHQCRICRRSYERADHLNRHLKSHENARPFHCSRCPKRFNRADLLSRHLATHDRHSSRDSDRPLIKRTDRAAAACHACAASKSKCEDQKPCRRCRTKNIPCETGASSMASQTRGAARDKFAFVNDHDNPTSMRGSHANPSHQMNDGNSNSTIANALGGSSGGHHTGEAPVSRSGQDFQQNTIAAGQNMPNTTISNNKEPSTAFYGATGGEGLSVDDMNDMLFLPNVSEFNQDLDFSLWDFNFEVVQFPTTSSPAGIVATQNSTTSNLNTTSKVTIDTARGYAAFKRSPWFWIPAQKDHQSNDSDNLALDEGSIRSGLTPSSTASLSVDPSTQNHHLDASSRDRMFALVLKMTVNIASRSVPAFPSLEILNHILHIFFVRQSYQVDHLIHSPTFSAAKARPHLILALISAGSTSISVPAVWKMGLALQEVVRLAVAVLWESNNKDTLDLQPLQAFMLCLDLGLWSGFKRKMEIAESFGQPLITMLRRAGAFASPRDSESLIPEPSDSGDRLENKWRKWIEIESYKRLSIHIFLHDTRASASLQKPPLLPLSELTFSIPASRDLWLADTAAKWKQRYLAKRQSWSPIPRMLDVMHDTSLFDTLRDHIDISLCSLAVLHGFWGRIWALQEASRFYLGNQNGQGNATHRVLLTAQHRELYQDIGTFATKLSDLAKQPSDIIIIVEFFVMNLHVSPDELQRFAGKSGEEEASRAANNLQKWVQTAEARTAVWHAGQIFRAAKSMPPAELRDFHAIAVYFASLTLWAYGLVSSSNVTQDIEGQTLPSHTQEERDRTVHVSLDGPETRETRVFLTLDQGLPGLNHPYGQGKMVFESLENPNMVLKIAREIYRNNFPALEEPLPPLVENLGNLMRDLGSLTGSRFSRSGSESLEK